VIPIGTRCIVYSMDFVNPATSNTGVTLSTGLITDNVLQIAKIQSSTDLH